MSTENLSSAKYCPCPWRFIKFSDSEKLVCNSWHRHKAGIYEEKKQLSFELLPLNIVLYILQKVHWKSVGQRHSGLTIFTWKISAHSIFYKNTVARQRASLHLFLLFINKKNHLWDGNKWCSVTLHFWFHWSTWNSVQKTAERNFSLYSQYEFLEYELIEVIECASNSTVMCYDAL